MMWLQNMDLAGSVQGASVGPVSGKGLMLLWVGRCWWAVFIAGETARVLGFG